MTNFSFTTRQANLQRLGREQFDLLIIGGGITGVGIARDAALRGFSVALIDKGDFASGTSSKSSKLVHGGVRYLELFQFGLVFEASRERRTLMQIAPHLVRAVPFIFPVYRDGRWPAWLIDLGLWTYDALALFRNAGRHHMLSRAAVAEKTRGIDIGNITRGAYYFDAQVDDARLTLETIRAAHRAGAVAANYVQVDALAKADARVVGADAHDMLTGEKISIRARVVVNATGVWSDGLAQMDDPRARRRLRPTKGAHIFVARERIGTENAATFPSFQDKRIMFLIPWGKFTIIGTTESDFDGDYDRVYADARDVAYILAAANHAFPLAKLFRADVISAYAGLRPLVNEGGKNATQTSREHLIWVSESGLITIAGGKLTTYRAMAEQLVNRVAKILRDEFNVVAKQKCATARLPLVASDSALEFARDGLGEDVAAHLARAYGANAARVAALAHADGRAARRIAEALPYLWAEVDYAMENEMPATLVDFLARRTHIMNEDGDNGIEVAPQVAARMAARLDWDRARIEKELRAYQDQVSLARKFM
ncbi:MAG: glycerol-3-phosphate dehydrogenase/oxidase [Chloroflexi bacterium]|nr:glycerol-3-phosphate dehydrogenase/oxidase [Chloroflexota bacterium]